jgi:hypothetical protein
MRWWLALTVVALYGLHQDVWFWNSAEPLVLGFLPIGLFYHLLYTVVVAGLMALLVRYAWPNRLEREAETAVSRLADTKSSSREVR